MFRLRYPQPLQVGDVIAVTAPSSGVRTAHHARLELVLSFLRSKGFEVLEGKCLRHHHKEVSASAQVRAQEFTEMYLDERVAAVMPPWGGELAIELLPLLDFDAFRRAKPKWVSGYSDISTLLLPLTTISEVATLHGPNLMELSPSQTDGLTLNTFAAMALPAGSTLTQQSSRKHQTRYRDYVEDATTSFRLTHKSRWKLLFQPQQTSVSFRGRLIGGCLDIVSCLAATRYGDVHQFAERAKDDGVILYLENCALNPCQLVRALYTLRIAGWFDHLSGILIGRSGAPTSHPADTLSYQEALCSSLAGIEAPIVYDVDIGHQPPQMALVNGALASVAYAEGRGSVSFSLT